MGHFNNNTGFVMIGAGNVGTHLSLALKGAGHEILQIYSRTEGSAKALAQKLDTRYTTEITEININADIYILALKDNVIQDVIRHSVLKDKFLVHTAGSLDMEVLKDHTKDYGVLYPLQTFSRSRQVDFREVPVCIEANTKDNEDILLNIGKDISGNVRLIDSENRLYLHLAAVFSCNFVNHMYSIAKNVLDSKGLSFEILKPLISEAAAKISEIPPAEAQTGPAVRNDRNIIDKHISLLSGSQKFQKMYSFVTESIYEYNK